MKVYNLLCDCCDKDFVVSPGRYYRARYDKKVRNIKHLCSKECRYKATGRFLRQQVQCKRCGKDFTKLVSEIRKTQSNFCSSSCAATYNNTHKTHGTRRSKLEAYIEEQLTSLYPTLEMHFNKKDAINSELDVFVPSLKLAFELNGIYHYEPIHGEEKLKSIQSNDNRKFQACLERGIELCIIDTSSQTYVKPKTSKKFLDIIVKVLESKMGRPGNDPGES